MHNKCNRNLLDRSNISLSAWTYETRKNCQTAAAARQKKIQRCSCTHFGLSVLCKRTRCNTVSANGYYAFVHVKAGVSTFGRLYCVSMSLFHLLTFFYSLFGLCLLVLLFFLLPFPIAFSTLSALWANVLHDRLFTVMSSYKRERLYFNLLFALYFCC